MRKRSFTLIVAGSVSCFFLANCTPTPETVLLTGPELPEIEAGDPLEPQGKRLASGIGDSSRTSENVSRSVTELKREIDRMASDRKKTQAELDRLLLQEGATKLELTNLNKMFQKERNMFLELKAEELDEMAKKHAEEMKGLSEEMQDFRLLLKDADDREQDLRDRVDFHKFERDTARTALKNEKDINTKLKLDLKNEAEKRKSAEGALALVYWVLGGLGVILTIAVIIWVLKKKGTFGFL